METKEICIKQRVFENDSLKEVDTKTLSNPLLLREGGQKR